jgi:hypothetical protein
MASSSTALSRPRPNIKTSTKPFSGRSPTTHSAFNSTLPMRTPARRLVCSDALARNLTPEDRRDRSLMAILAAFSSLVRVCLIAPLWQAPSHSIPTISTTFSIRIIKACLHPRRAFYVANYSYMFRGVINPLPMDALVCPYPALSVKQLVDVVRDHNLLSLGCALSPFSPMCFST